MSAPRPIVPGTTYLLTRRCSERRFFLKPSAKTNQIFKFCLAVASQRTGVRVHEFCVVSNHYHVVATDVRGKLPVFMHWLNEYVAKCINADLGRWESFWAPGSYSAVALADRQDVLDKLTYVRTNPVAAHLVKRAHDWPGASSPPEAMAGSRETIRRPVGFFRANGPVPALARLELSPPPAFDGDERWLDTLRRRIRLREAEIVQAAARENRRFLGARRVRAGSPRSRPRPGEPRRGLNPRVAARDKWRRIEALQRLVGFVRAYREAWLRFTRGDHEVRFPYGTYGMRVRFGVQCAGP